MPKYIRSVPDDIVDAFQVNGSGATPVPDWFTYSYEIIKVGIVFETGENTYEVARWGDFIVKSETGYIRVEPPGYFNIVYKLVE